MAEVEAALGSRGHHILRHRRAASV
jgi:hypothetical protein